MGSVRMSAWDTLGVPVGAPMKEVTAAYRRLALVHHPDRGGKAEDFARITEAYESIKSGRGLPMRTIQADNVDMADVWKDVGTMFSAQAQRRERVRSYNEQRKARSGAFSPGWTTAGFGSFGTAGGDAFNTIMGPVIEMMDGDGRKVGDRVRVFDGRKTHELRWTGKEWVRE